MAAVYYGILVLVLLTEHVQMTRTLRILTAQASQPEMTSASFSNTNSINSSGASGLL